MNQQRLNMIRVAAISWLMVLLTACEQNRYLLVIGNNTTAQINEIEITFSGQSFPTRDLKPGQQETAIFEHPPLSEVISVSWQTGGQPFSQTFQTFNHIPRSHHHGRVMIQINADQTASLIYQNQ
ncbi:hypothetical protein ACFODZ_13965 [Marinicella sediminis]|uniref:Lipoprotein n=2 Tax=Marinicella sediminis TaxID=1792834 RepID=A0ABV7JER4_9GAMM